MCLRSCVVAEWATTRWVLPSRTLVLSRLSVSLCIAYSLLYRSLSSLNFSFLFIFSFIFPFGLLGLLFFFFFGFAFLKKRIYMDWVNDSWFWREPKLQSKGGSSLFFFFNLKIKLLIFFFFGPGGPRPPPGLVPSFECHKTICLSIYSLSVVMNSWDKMTKALII